MVAASGKLKLVLARHWLIEYLDRPHWRDRKGKVNTERGSDASWHQRAFVNNMHYTTTLTKIIREDVKKKSFFWGDFSQMWVYGVADSQTGSKPLKYQISPKIAFFDPNFTFRSPKSHKNPWVGKQIWERSPKKNRSFWTPSLLNPKHLKQITSQIFSQNF